MCALLLCDMDVGNVKTLLKLLQCVFFFVSNNEINMLFNQSLTRRKLIGTENYFSRKMLDHMT